MGASGPSDSVPVSATERHILTTSAVAAAIGTAPAALLSSYKTIGMILGIVNLLLLIAVAVFRLKDSVGERYRRHVLIGSMCAVLVLSWCVTGWSLYRMSHQTTQGQAAQSAAAHPSPVVPVTATTPPVANQITTTGKNSPVITGSGGPIYIGDAPPASETKPRRKSK